MKTLLISLVSDQTSPNVQLIKEFKEEVDEYLFLTTDSMEKKGCRKWIISATDIKNTLEPCMIQQFSFDDIETKLDKIDFTHYTRLIVNLTGGTKITTLATYEYFKQLGAEIYYVTGIGNSYIKLFPGRKKEIIEFKQKRTISDYLKSHGFESKYTEASGISYEQTSVLLSKYLENEFMDHYNALASLRSKRNKKTLDISNSEKIKSFLEYIEFNPTDNKLSSAEIKYLTGDWLEEYVTDTIKKELALENEEIATGVILSKNLPSEHLNSVEQLLDVTDNDTGPVNEFDVMFTYKNNFYTVECKTSIYYTDANGKEIDILGETIYKADYLKNKFGLRAKSNILTLTDFQKYTKNNNSRKNKYKELINRCNLSNIKLIDGNMISDLIENKTSLSDLIL